VSIWTVKLCGVRTVHFLCFFPVLDAHIIYPWDAQPRLATLRNLVSRYGHNRKFIRNVLGNLTNGVFRMKSERVMAYGQRVEQYIESFTCGRGIYTRWHRSRATTGRIKYIVFGQCYRKDWYCTLVQNDIVLWCNPTEKRSSASQRSDPTAYQLICGMDQFGHRSSRLISRILRISDKHASEVEPFCS
jgi:hypothetical protein